MPHPGHPTSTLRRRTRTRHRSPPRTGCALFRLTSSRPGPAPHVVGQRLVAGVTVAAFVPAELRPDHLAAAGTLTQAELPARDLGHGSLLLLPALLRMLSPCRAVSRSLAELAREVSGAGLVILAAPACGTGARRASPLGWRAYRSAGSERHPQPAGRSRCRARTAGRRACQHCGPAT